jgi:hypothetical protein
MDKLTDRHTQTQTRRKADRLRQTDTQTQKNRQKRKQTDRNVSRQTET